MIQQRTSAQLREELRQRCPRSEALWQRAQAVFPGGEVNGMRRFKPFPFYAERAEGSTIWDVDGNQYIDCALTYGVHLLGHRPNCVVNAVQDQMGLAFHYGSPYEREIEFAEKFARTSPCTERLAMCNSGTEAVLKAITIARAYTGKNKVAKFEGGFHGSHEYSMWSPHAAISQMGSVEAPTLVRQAGGMPRGVEDSLVLLPFDDENAFRLIEEHAGDLAVVMIEPVLVAYGMPANTDFLSRLRETTQKNAVLLMYDEVVTKYRIALGGGEEYFGVSPDLNAFGKAIGGGLPVGAVGCRAEVLDAVFLREDDDTVEIGGTFSGNAMTVAAAHAVLDHLVAHPEIYPDLNWKGDYLRSEYNTFAERQGHPSYMTGIGSMFRVHMLSGPLTKPRDCVTENPKLVKDMALLLRLNGVYLPSPARMGFLSTAHSDEDVEFVLEAHKVALRECMEINRVRLW